MNTPTQSVWTPTSWRSFPISQLPPYPNDEALEYAFSRLRALPPLITSWEVEALKEKLAQVGEGKAFLLQGGDCAESFADCTSPRIVNMLKVILQMSFILVHEMSLPVVRVGRIAGQYAKPRSADQETINGSTFPTYRGDLINGFDASGETRTPDPERLIEAYSKAGLTLNFLRALLDEGFADLHHPEHWELDFMKNNGAYREYEALVKSISKTIRFMDSVTPLPSSKAFPAMQRVELYTSHEALNLYYDAAQTRQVPNKTGWYNLSSHMVWVGNRTRQLGSAHLEYLRGIENPIGIKVSADADPAEMIQIVRQLNPEDEPGKIVMISRYGAGKIEEHLPVMIRAFRKEGLNVVWSVDPMHGNTFSTQSSIKTRNFEDIMSEIRSAFKVHGGEGSILGAVHLELTGDNVTECVGGSKGLGEQNLGENYSSLCDPRLNYEQSLELAFLVAKEWNASYG